MLIGCQNRHYNYSEDTEYSFSEWENDIPIYTEPVFDDTNTAIPTNNPHYPVTIEQQPEVVWDNSQTSLKTGKKKLDFYNINDIHGTVDEKGNYAGIRKISSYVKTQRDKNPNGYVFTSSGDSWQGSADSNLTRGILIDAWLEHLGCSAMALGNHEFDWTIDTITYNDSEAGFPFLACNIIRSDNNEVVDWVRPFTTITRNGVNIGIIGAIGEGITSSITASHVRGLTFADPLPYVAEWSNYLKNNGADVILFLYHYSTEDLSSEYANYVDAIFGGHNHAFESNYINGIPAIEAAAYGRGLGHIQLMYDFDNNKVVARVGETISSKDISLYNEDKATNALIASFSSVINEIKNEKVAYIPGGLSDENLVLLMERYMYKYYLENEENPKTLFSIRHNQSRQDLPSGYVTYGDIYSAFPFDNALVVCKSNYEYADYHAYTSYYPNGNDASTLKDENDDVYLLTINYLSEHETYGEYLTEVQVYNGAFPRDIMKKYIGEDYPLR